MFRKWAPVATTNRTEIRETDARTRFKYRVLASVWRHHLRRARKPASLPTVVRGIHFLLSTAAETPLQTHARENNNRCTRAAAAAALSPSSPPSPLPKKNPPPATVPKSRRSAVGGGGGGGVYSLPRHGGRLEIPWRRATAEYAPAATVQKRSAVPQCPRAPKYSVPLLSTVRSNGVSSARHCASPLPMCVVKRRPPYRRQHHASTTVCRSRHRRRDTKPSGTCGPADASWYWVSSRHGPRRPFGRRKIRRRKSGGECFFLITRLTKKKKKMETWCRWIWDV